MIRRVILAIVLSLILVNPLTAQKEVGKLFTAEDAKTLFGNVTNERIIPISEIKSYLKATDNYLLVYLDVWSYRFAGDGFKPIYPTNQKTQTIYYKFSKSKVLELIDRNLSSENISIQLRTNTLTLQINNDVLELSLPCPPYCEE